MGYLDQAGLSRVWSYLKTQLDKKTNNTDLLNKIYPVGSIYLTMGSTSPATLFGGTWKQLSGGYLYANAKNAGATGGGHTISIGTANLPAHTHSIPSHVHSIPAHTHSVPSHTHSLPSHTHSLPNHTHGYTRADSVGYHTITWNELASHSHGYLNIRNVSSDGHDDYGIGQAAGYSGRVVITFDGTKQTDSAGGGASHNHGLSTSWQSTGGASGTSGATSGTSGATGGTTGSAGSGNTGSTGGTSGSTGSGTAITFYPEYINVYMWRRTA